MSGAFAHAGPSDDARAKAILKRQRKAGLALGAENGGRASENGGRFIKRTADALSSERRTLY